MMWSVGFHKHSVVAGQPGPNEDVLVWVPSWRSRLDPKAAAALVQHIVDMHNGEATNDQT